MPSRKRNKAKEKRAKAAAAQSQARPKQSKWERWARWGRIKEEVQCSHGCDLIPMPGHAVYEFMNAIEEGVDSIESELEAIEKSFALHPEVWKDAEMRNISIRVLSAVGANLILYGKDTESILAGYIAKVMIILEHYNGEDDLGPAIVRGVALLRRSCADGMKFKYGNSRDVIRFFSKKVPCSCLEKKHKHAKKTMPKESRCDGCMVVKERKSLMVCSRCRIAHYCCRECQVADWPNHGALCRIIVEQLALDS